MEIRMNAIDGNSNTIFRKLSANWLVFNFFSD